MKSYSWFKLLLDEAEATKYDDPQLATSEGKGVLSKPSFKSAVDLCADFLQEIAGFAHAYLAQRISHEVLAATPLDFRFTVPAVWTDKARSDTRRAARQAAKQAQLPFHRDTQIDLIREPEAAAIATLHSLSRGASEQQIKPGDSVLICDCGGGTVDIISYRVKAIEPKLDFHELVAGTGGKCGSTYVDREFIKWMESTFKGFYTNLNWANRGPTSSLMKAFEGVKRDAGKSKDPRKYHEMVCVMPGLDDCEHYDADTHSVKIYEEELRHLFAPVVDRILALLQTQLDAEKRQDGVKSIKTVILVGGFGDSVYLNERIRGWCQPLGIRLICPEHPQAAIVRGAALSGLLDIQPTSRRSRRHYGFEYVYDCDCDPLRHRNQDTYKSYKSPWNGRLKCGGNLKWELAKDSLVDEHTSISLEVTRNIFAANPGTQRLTIWSSERDNPPDHVNFGGCSKVATCKLDFSGVDLTRFTRKPVGGRAVHQVDMEYRIHFGARQGLLIFSASAGGIELGNTSLSFDGDDAASLASVEEEASYLPTCSVQ